MAGVGYLAAAYAAVLLGLAGYALALSRRERALRREAASARAAPGRRGG
jgi:CcmD family protein